MFHRFMRGLLLLALLAAEIPAADITPREAQRYGVDIVLVKGGVELRGAVLSQDAGELRLAVQRTWLTSRQPEILKAADAETDKLRAASRTETLARIEAWIEARADQTRLVAVLKKEADRLQKVPLEAPEQTQFVTVRLPADRVRRVFTAPAASRQLAMVAWREQLERVEELTLTTLKPAVERRVPEWATERVDLSDRIPTGEPQSSDEWAARQAIFEYEYGEPLQFQGTGNMLVQVGAGAEKPDLAALFASAASDTLAGQLEGLGLDLGQPTPKAKPVGWKATAIEQAASLDRSGFSVTRVPQITGSGPATVSVAFFARLSHGEWQPIWSDEVTTDPASIKPAELERLQADPQVQEILKITKALSLGDSANQAVRFGAAVQTSQQGAATHFFEFRQRYNATLDGPPLTWKP